MKISCKLKENERVNGTKPTSRAIAQAIAGRLAGAGV